MKKSVKNAIGIIAILSVIVVCVAVISDSDSCKFSDEPGFYSEDVDLKIQKGFLGTVYYTLDGSEPTPENGIKYDGSAIHLTDATELPNRGSARSDCSVGFDEEVTKLFPDNNFEFKIPDFNVDKAYYVRARYYNCFGIPGKENTGMFFVNLDDRGYYDNISVTSITTDEANLWDSKTGIYCTGDAYAQWKKSLESGEVKKSELPEFWKFVPSNYNTLLEYDGERECHVEFYDESHSLTMSTDCGLRLQGHAARKEAQKAFSIFCREEYNGSDKFDVDLTNSGYKQHKYCITAAGEDQFAKLDDYILADDISKDLNFAQSNYRATMLFLNGEFWGFYWIFEPYNEEYLQAHYNVDAENVVKIEHNLVDIGLDSDQKINDEDFDFLCTADMTVDENYQKACEILDMGSFVDYYAMMYYVCRMVDWPMANEAWWYVREPSEEIGWNDGRWRFMVFDLNSEDAAMEVSQVDDYMRALNDPMWLHLMQNESFRAYFAERIQYIAYEAYHPDKIDARIDGYLAKYIEAIKASNKRYFGDEREEDILMNAAEKKYFFHRRHDICKYIVGYLCGTKYVIDEK